MKTFKQLYTLQFQTKESFEDNLKKLSDLISVTDENSIMLAPEVSLTNFSYNNLEKASEFSNIAKIKIKSLSKNKLIALTLIEKIDDKFFNVLNIFYNNEIIYKQNKVKLFKLGNEDRYFSAGEKSNIKIFKVNGLKIACLICFELRFIELWKQIQGADIILIPAMWGKQRKKQFEILTTALAVANQCFVIASNSSNENMALSSGIITPFGETIRDDKKEFIKIPFNFKEIDKIRRYIDIEIKN